MRTDRYGAGGARILAVATVSVCLALAPLSANPFMGAGSASEPDGKRAATVSPVRTSPADRRLVNGQASLRDALGDYFYDWKANGSKSLFWGIIGAAFLYGMLHALGPGHRKTVIFSLYLARGAPAWEPAGTGALLSLLHGGAAVVLLLILRGVTGAISGKADNIVNWMEGSAYILLIAVALWLVVHAIVDLARGGSRHDSGAMSLGTILVTGIYPCPGAILILVLSLSLDITGIGILAVFAMSLGMSLPVIAAGYLAWAGRTGLFHALKKNENVIGKVSAGIGLAGYSFLLAFAVNMAMPFIASLARMAGLA